MQKARNTVIVSIILFNAIAVPGWAGSLVSWGYDVYGEVSNTPSGNDFVAIASGGRHSVALKSDGSLVAWGVIYSNTPAGNDFAAVAAGYAHSVALKSDGSLVSWGWDDGEGQVSDTPAGNDFAAVAAGEFHSMALKSDGSLVAWGRDGEGQVSNTPTGNDFLAVSAGGFYNVALKSDGSLVAWGEDDVGLVSNTPAGNNFAAVSAGYLHSVALKSDGSLVSWGYDVYGQVSNTPAGNNFKAVSAGGCGWHSVALKSDGSLVAWGWDDYGQVSNTPAGSDFVAVSAGGWHSVAIYETCPPEPPHAPWSFVQMTDTHIGYTEEDCMPVPLPGGGTVLRCWEVASASDRLAAAIDQILEEVKSGTRIKPDFILVTGDIADYGCSNLSACNDLYGDFILALQRLFDQNIKVVTVPGNHDRAKPDPFYLALCNDGLRCYYQNLVLGTNGDICADLCSFDHKGLLFVGLDTGYSGLWNGIGARGEGLTDPQWGVFKATLEDEENLCKPKVVFMHHPPVDVGSPDQTFKHYKEDFITCCANNNVRLVLAGHTHEDHVLNGDEQELEVDTTERPLFIQTRSIGKDQSPSHGYRWFNVTYTSPPNAHPETSSDILDDSDRIRVSLYSPGSLHMYDLLGEHHTGMTTTGEAELGIPRSYYFSHHVVSTDDGDEVLPEKIIVFGQANDYLYEVIGSETGTYRVEIKAVQGGGEIVFRATEIPTLPGARHIYAVNWEALSAGEEDAVVLEIDADGDGIFERTVIADKDLTSEEFALQTKTVIDFEPDTLNLRSPGKVVTAYIELPEGFNVSDIDVSKLKLNDSVPALLKPITIGDHDEDGIADLMVKFDRQQVIEVLGSGTQMVTLTGRLSDGRPLAGIDFIRVIDGTEAEAVATEFESTVPEGFIADMEDNLQTTTDDSVDIGGEDAFGVKEVVGFMLFEASETINELGPESFNNEESAFELACAINDVFTMLDEGMYFEVMVILDGDILERMDGYTNIGQPDEDDWVTSIEGQVLLYPLLTETIELLESML